MADFSIERILHAQGYKFVAGVDEAGRGPLAGPVVAAAVVLKDNEELFIEVNDSKQLNSKKREELYDLIVVNAVSYSVVAVESQKIDEINILQATFLAMQTAIGNLPQVDYLLIDGNKFVKSAVPYQTVVKGDGISKSIAAASILAKVSRDRCMLKLDKEFPQYNFAKHKGYPTKEHIAAILKYGICKYHRKSFLTKIYERQISLF